MADVTIDMRAALFAAAVTAAVGVMAGLTPALRLARTDVSDTLRQQSRGTTGGHRLMRGLVVGEVALAVVLLVSAGLMVENLQRLLGADLGLRADALYTVALPLPPRYASPEQRIQVVRQLHDSVGAPGIERAGLSPWNPLGRAAVSARCSSRGAAARPGESGFVVNHRQTPQWMERRASRCSGDARSRPPTPPAVPVTIVSRRRPIASGPVRTQSASVRQARPTVQDHGGGRGRRCPRHQRVAQTCTSQHAAHGGGTVHLMVIDA